MIFGGQMMGNKQIQIRQMNHIDIPFAMELKNIAGWNQTEADWMRYMNLEPDGCFIAEVDGEKAGTGTALSYGKFGWIGMILVHPTKRRLGLGTEMLHKTIGYLQSKGVTCIKLDATPMGKQVYIPLGFEDEYEVQRFERKARFEGELEQVIAFPDLNVLPITADVLDEIVAFDADYFGAKRKLSLTELWNSSLEQAYYMRNEQGIVGIIMAHQGQNALQIGPWIAKDAGAAEQLFAKVVNFNANSSIFLDVPCPNEDGIKLMEQYGFTVQRGFYRMYLGGNPFPGIPQEIYATSGPEKG